MTSHLNDHRLKEFCVLYEKEICCSISEKESKEFLEAFVSLLEVSLSISEEEGTGC